MKPRFIAGADEDVAEAPVAPRRLRYPCIAHNCPMPGTIFPGGTTQGICAWHITATGDQLPKVTQALQDWQCLAIAINRGRAALVNPATCASPKELDRTQAELWGSLKESLAGSGWTERLKPEPQERLPDWSRRLERFLANRVKERLRPSVRIDDDNAPTPTVAEMRSRLRPGQSIAKGIDL